MIKNIVHFFWSSGEIPERYRECIDSWNDYKIWTPNELGVDVSLPRNFQSDIARWKILYEYGGIYCDCDMLLVGDISMLPESFCVETGYPVPIMNCFIGAKQGDSLMKMLLDETIKMINGNCRVIDLCIMNADLLKQHGTVLPIEYCPIEMHGSLNTKQTEKTVAIHKHFLGWKEQ